MKGYYHIIFWLAVFLILTLAVGRSYGSLVQSLYFISFLFPVIVGTSYIFNSFLVPKYLLQKKYFKFVQYLIYTLVFSVYLEMLVIILSLILIVNYNYEELDPKTSDIYLLTFILYFFVILNTIILLLQKYFKEQEKKQELEAEKDTLKKGHLLVRSERKNTIILFDNIEYIESLGNYIKIFTSSDKTIVSKEKISSIVERLPECFLRIHRSYIVNRNKIESYTKDWIIIDENRLPISRKYKESVIQDLSLQGNSRILASS